MQKQPTASNVQTPTKSKPRKQRKNRHKRRNKQQKCQNTARTTTTANNYGLSLWTRTYENIVRWHSDHQMNYWKSVAEKFEKQNIELREQLRQFATESSDDEEENEILLDDNDVVEDIDEEYLKFLEVTNKHREDLRLQRLAADNSETEEDKFLSAVSSGMTECIQQAA